MVEQSSVISERSMQYCSCSTEIVSGTKVDFTGQAKVFEASLDRRLRPLLLEVRVAFMVVRV